MRSDFGSRGTGTPVRAPARKTQTGANIASFLAKGAQAFLPATSPSPRLFFVAAIAAGLTVGGAAHALKDPLQTLGLAAGLVNAQTLIALNGDIAPTPDLALTVQADASANDALQPGTIRITIPSGFAPQAAADVTPEIVEPATPVEAATPVEPEPAPAAQADHQPSASAAADELKAKEQAAIAKAGDLTERAAKIKAAADAKGRDLAEATGLAREINTVRGWLSAALAKKAEASKAADAANSSHAIQAALQAVGALNKVAESAKTTAKNGILSQAARSLIATKAGHLEIYAAQITQAINRTDARGLQIADLAATTANEIIGTATSALTGPHNPATLKREYEALKAQAVALRQQATNAEREAKDLTSRRQNTERGPVGGHDQVRVASHEETPDAPRAPR